jgi:DNA-binding LacI/PurR family transcriptional regulator
MPTMADVAKRAGVAISTVSYALSGVRPVSPETKQRIQQAIEELGYHPNLLARGLAGKPTRVVALLFPAAPRGLSQVQLEFVSGAAEVASRTDHALLLWTSAGEDQQVLRLAMEGLVEGLILMEIRLCDPRVVTLRKLGYPFTMIGHCQDNEGLSFVDFDFEEAARVSVRHLAELGHRYIACLTYSPAPLEMGYGPAVRSKRGFETALEENNLNGLACVYDGSPQQAYQVMWQVLAAEPSTSAVIVTSDLAYPSIVQATTDFGRRIPHDLSLVAFMSQRGAELATPPLSYVEIPAHEMGRIGAELLIERLEGKEQQPTQLILPAQLAVRSSSGPPGAHRSVIQVHSQQGITGSVESSTKVSRTIYRKKGESP